MTAPQIRQLDDAVTEVLAALECGGTDAMPLRDGRVIAVLATPSNHSSEWMSIGLAALPPAYSTPEHSHPAEEIALVIRGSGVIAVDGHDVPVSSGSIVVVPPNSPHITTSGPDAPLVVFWSYGPAGSESRWLSSAAKSQS